MNVASTIRPVNLLLIEDNPGDVFLIKKTLKDAKLLNRVLEVGDGIQAMAALRQEVPFTDFPRPDLILLDLNLPKKDGREVLREIKQDPELCHIPILVLTSSREQEDVLQSYDLHVNAYIAKPMNVEGLIQAVKMLEGFWFSIVKLPTKAV